jgi:Right handed beta helix region
MPTIQEAVQAAAPGDTITIPAGVYDVSNLVLPSNITLQADGNATIVGDLIVNGSNTTVKGFTFSGGGVDISQSNGATIANNVFNGGETSIKFDGANGAHIANNDFNNVQGSVVDGWGLDQSTISGNHFVDCRQPINLDFNNDPSRGHDITVDHNTFTGTTRMPIEVGPTGAYTSNLVIRDNWSDNMNNSGPDPNGMSSAVAYSIISTNGVNTLITGNYAKGPGGISVGIEMDGSGEISNNNVEGFAYGAIVYGSGFNVHDNHFLDTPIDTVLNYAGKDGTIQNNTSDAASFDPPSTPPTTADGSGTATPADPAPADPASGNPAPTTPTTADGSGTAAPADPAPADPASGSPAPTTPTTADGSGTAAPADPVPTDPTPVDPTPAPGTGGTTTPPGHGHSAGGNNGHAHGHHALADGTTALTTALQDVQATQTSDHSTGGQSVDATGNAAPTDGTTAQQDVQATQASDHSTGGQSVDASGNGAPTDGTTAQQDVLPTQVPDHSTGGQSVDASGNVAPTDGTTASQDVQAAQSADGHATVSFNGITEPDAALTAPDAVSLEAAYQSALDQHHSTSINFDVEGSAALDQNSISLRDHALVDLEAANPDLKVAFTVTAQPTGLDANALSVLQSAKDDGVRIDAVKILVEHFGQSADGNSHTALISAVTAAEKQLADLGLDAKLGFAWDGNSAGAHADGAHADGAHVHDAHVASSDASGMVPQPFEFSGVLHHHDHIG